MLKEEISAEFSRRFVKQNNPQQEKGIAKMADFVANLLSLPAKRPSYRSDREIQQESFYNTIDLVARLMDNPGIDISTIEEVLIFSEFDFISLAEGLLGVHDVDPIKLIKIFLNIPKIDQIKLIGMVLLHSSVDLTELTEVLLAVRFNFVDLIKKLLKQSSINSKHADRRIEFIRAILSHPAIIVTSEKNFAIQYVAAYGYGELVELLLNNPRVSSADRITMYKLAVQCAATNGYVKLVDFLLKKVQSFAVDFNIALENLSDMNELALYHAREYGHVNLIYFLLNDIKSLINKANIGSINILNSYYENTIKDTIKIAGKNRHPAVIEMLLDHFNVHINTAIRVLAEENSMEAIGQLLLDKRADLGLILTCAAQEGHVGIVRAVLECPCLHSRDRISLIDFGIEEAAVAGHVEVVKALLDHVPKENREAKCRRAIVIADRNKHSKLIKTLEDKITRINRAKPNYATLCDQHGLLSTSTSKNIQDQSEKSIPSRKFRIT